MKRKSILSLLLILCLLWSLAACGSAKNSATSSDLTMEEINAVLDAEEAANATEPPAETAEPANTQTPIPTPDATLPINVMVMNGPTGFGMAKLMHDAANGEAALNYNISVESDASNAAAALINGSTDIAVLPTNAAATVYNRTEGGVMAAAEVVRGNLYLLQNTEKENITSVADLAGKTVYAPAQNPTFIFNYIARENGLEIEADNTYAQPADLRTALTAGEVDLAVLPEPMVTIAMSANDKLDIALTLDELWRDAVGGNIVLGCVAVRAAFAEEHPAELSEFLKEYNDSVFFLGEHPAEAAQMIADTGIFAQAAVAEKAIPRCGLCFVTGEQMKDELSQYLTALFEIAPQSVGGALPGDDFYYTTD